MYWPLGRRYLWGLCVGVALLLGRTPRARAFDVPTELAPWVPWVLALEPEYGCPLVNGARRCVWPGRLNLELTNSGGRFRLNSVAEREADIELPGGPGQWPIAVRNAQGALAVRDVGGKPVTRIPRGSTDIDGRFVWSKLPETLAIPEQVGLVRLSINGQGIHTPRRDPNLLWLTPESAQATSTEQTSARA